MPEIHQDAKSFRAGEPWGARDLATVEGATVRLHWSDEPYRWHVNDGCEVFVVLAGVVEMALKSAGETELVKLEAGDIFVAHVGDEHMARPLGEARILVVEKAGSI